MSVGWWWMALCVVSILNVALWTYSGLALVRRRPRDEALYAARWPHLLLSAGYVFGCGFRSVLPRADVQRICLMDTWLSNVFVGRSVATVAELCFAAQWALLLRELSSESGTRFGLAVAYSIVPLIALAETASWYAARCSSPVTMVVMSGERSAGTLTGSDLVKRVAETGTGDQERR